MHNACLSGNAKVVRELLRAKADPNALDSKQSSPAHEAAKGGHFEVVQVLSGYGAKFDVYDVLGNNPIHNAAASNAGTAIRFLGQRGIENYADIVSNNSGICVFRLQSESEKSRRTYSEENCRSEQSQRCEEEYAQSRERLQRYDREFTSR